jgi:hypothetical protein
LAALLVAALVLNEKQTLDSLDVLRSTASISASELSSISCDFNLSASASFAIDAVVAAVVEADTEGVGRGVVAVVVVEGEGLAVMV